MLQAMILRSPHAHAKILSVDPSQALANANVVAVITPDDIKQNTKPFKPGRYAAGLKRPIDEYAGAVDKVRYVGEPLGAVAARDRGTAEDALELISVEYEPIRPVVDVREAIKPSSATLFEELGSNLAWHGSLQYGDIDGAFKSADRVVKENLKNSPLQLDAAGAFRRHCILRFRQQTTDGLGHGSGAGSYLRRFA